MTLSVMASIAGRTKSIRKITDNAPKVRLDRMEQMVGSVRSSDIMKGAIIIMSPDVIIV